MNFLLVLLCTVVLVFALKKPVKRFPVLFYGIAVLLDVLFICNAFVPFPRSYRARSFSSSINARFRSPCSSS